MISSNGLVGLYLSVAVNSINIVDTEFTDNHADAVEFGGILSALGGNDIMVASFSGNADDQFQCPSPGREVGFPLGPPLGPIPANVSCFFSKDYQSNDRLSVVLPTVGNN